jgi:hypothetical protein
MDESFAAVRFVVFAAVRFVVFVVVELVVEFTVVFVLFGGRFELGTTIGMP